MAEKIRVLVFPCGSEIGLELHRALSRSTHIELFGGSSVSSNHGKYVYRNYIEGIPFVDAPNFVPELNRIIENLEIDLLYPAHDDVVLQLSENEEELSCGTIGSSVATCRICRSKKKTYSELASDTRVPRAYDSVSDIETYPVFMKPDVGQGSKGTHIAKSPEEVCFHLKSNPSSLVLEYLPGREYTVDCLTDRKRELRFVGARERIRTLNGIVTDTKPVADERFEHIADKINRKLHLRGAWFFQIKESSSGELVLLEVAPRTAGGMGLFRNLGINFALLSVFDRLDMDIEIDRNLVDMEMDRALFNRFRTEITYEHVYVDLDDTLLLKDKVNEWMVAFLYQCRNRGVKVHLVTSHKGDLAGTLRDFRLEQLFDTISHVTTGENKLSCIREKSAIFIDDSFSERSRVHRELGIPVFGVDALESLIDWRV